MIDQALGQQWREAEGNVLAKMVPASERDESLKAWLELPENREETRKRIAAGLVLRAIAIRDKVDLSTERIREELAELCALRGIDYEQTLVGLEHGDPERNKELSQMLASQLVVKHVLSKVALHIVQ
jgi:FKBP-type peptidyl-prolyl cis-trans isomerase (trigger factor)